MDASLHTTNPFWEEQRCCSSRDSKSLSAGVAADFQNNMALACDPNGGQNDIRSLSLDSAVVRALAAELPPGGQFAASQCLAKNNMECLSVSSLGKAVPPDKAFRGPNVTEEFQPSEGPSAIFHHLPDEKNGTRVCAARREPADSEGTRSGVDFRECRLPGSSTGDWTAGSVSTAAGSACATAGNWRKLRAKFCLRKPSDRAGVDSPTRSRCP